VGHGPLAALDRAKAVGIERVELDVYSSNGRAKALYDALGFIEEGRRVGARKLDGLTEDLILMVWRPDDPPAAISSTHA
jgi:RimJ/RimL family protein N-acetyltransferase